MSLINKMLQDLESRRATLSGDAGATQEIRSLPPPRAVLPRSLILGGVVVVLLAGAGTWWFLGVGQPAMAPTPVPAPVATGVPATPIAPASVAVAPEPPQKTVEIAPAATSAIAAPQAAAELPDAEKAPVPPPPPARKPVQNASPSSDRNESQVPRKVIEPRSTGLKVATALSQTSSSDALAADDGSRIEKKVRISTPRERAENEYRRALGLVNQGRIQEGMAVLRGALSEDAGHTGSRLALSSLLIEQQRQDEAQELLQEALSRNPAQPQLASQLARLQMERNDARGAEETLSKAAAAAAGMAEYRGLHAAVLQRLTRHKEAIVEYQAALRLAPQAGVWWMGLGISLEADGKLSEAREAYHRARATGALTLELNAFVDQKLKRLQ